MYGGADINSNDIHRAASHNNQQPQSISLLVTQGGAALIRMDLQIALSLASRL